ncbi:MAG TPA: MFS transporter [Pirellulales bacterium]|jgi:MFS family permease|nr:MFS transporter [Pirellulales bacterium]
MGEIYIEHSAVPADPHWRWWRELSRYHWFVLVVAALGWVFDCLDQQLFNLARMPAMKDLLRDAATGTVDAKLINYWAPMTTAVFLVGWATGGIIFGILGDRIGRVRTMVITILAYSACTGLSALSTSVYTFSFYRFLTGLGVGGEFAVGVALVAESMPDRARPYALGLLQALSTIGNVSAAGIGMVLGRMEQSQMLEGLSLFGQELTAWRTMFLVGTLPALLAVLVQIRLKEPDRWRSAVKSGAGPKPGSVRELFGDPRWRRRAIVGMLMATAGVVGLWGIGFFSFDLNSSVFKKYYEQQARDQTDAVAEDRRFLREIVADPASLDGIKDQITSNTLISPTSEHRDAQVIFEAMQELHGTHQVITEDSILASLDQKTEKRAAQSASDRARRAEYLSGAVEKPVATAAEVARIHDRAGKISGSLVFWSGVTSLTFNLGAFFGIVAFSRLCQRIGRVKMFALSFFLAMISTALVVMFIQRPTDVFWMTPIMGFCQLSLFGGYAIYFPELFPTRLRSTGISFCYNCGRYLAAGGTLVLGYLASVVFAGTSEPLRWSSLAMCSIFVIGLLALPFAPETRGEPLPE